MKKARTIDKPVVKSFNCPNCGSTLNITAVGLTVSVSCKSCKSIIDTKDENFQILKKANDKRTVRPAIPIGTRGKFSGKVYEVIGFMVRSDSGFYWREYLLFNPYHGFRWLTEIEGHWSYVKKINTIGDTSNGWSSYQKFKNKNFKLFNRGSATVSYVEGEFYWRVKEGDYAAMYDFISPPYMISKEVTRDEVTWSQSTYIERERIASIFDLDVNDLPKQKGVGANQPSDFKLKFKETFKYALIAAGICFVIHLFFMGYRDNVHLISKDGSYGSHTFQLKEKNVRSKYEDIKTEPFVIKNDNKNIVLYASSNLSNSWLFLDASLINTRDGSVINIPLEVSFYHGSDWSEGSRSGEKFEFDIPKGEYYLFIEPMFGGNRVYSPRVTLALKSDVPIASNLYWILEFCLAPLLFIGFRRRAFEVRRWSNSSENPYEE